jgi:multidrug efflux system membrane fusion protein
MRIASILILFLCGCHSKSQEAPLPSGVPVRVAIAQVHEMPLFIEAMGHVESINSIQLRSRIEGELTGVYFVQGQEVKKGDLLFTIDPKPYLAALKQAQGALEVSQAGLAISGEKVKRYKTLLKDEYYSQLDYETLQADFAQNLGLVQQNQAQVDSANINLDYCWLYAPIDGMTGILQVDYGNLVRADDPQSLVTLNQMAPIYVTFAIPENQLPKIQMAKQQSACCLKVVAAYEDFKGETFEGSLYMLDNTVDAATGMIKLRGLFENTKRELWPGQFVRTRLVLDTVERAVIIPYSAVQITLNGMVAFVVKEDLTVEQRSLKLGQRQDDTVLVLEGIKEGEKVVTEGQINLYNGAKVVVKGER